MADRVADGAYRQSLGLMTQIREDFETMSVLLMRDSSEHELNDLDAAGDSLPQIDRIVLYIDDLDRCPPARVVQVLEVIHLMLAVPLFVVVVAVDPRWLIRAIAVHYREVLSEDEPRGSDHDWASTPVQYLDKIFQVSLNLSPLDTSGFTALIEDLVVHRESGMTRSREQPIAVPTVPTERAGSTAAAKAADEPELPTPDVVEQVDPLALSSEELAIIRLLGPPLVTTPRSVKRLVNSYALLVTIRRLRGQSTGAEELRPALVLLAALVGFPELGGQFLSLLHQRSRENSSSEWRHFVAKLAGEETPGQSGSPTEVAEARTRWIRLSESLTALTDRANAQGVPLPPRLTAWATWVTAVGRLAFPAGSIVAGLDRES